MIDRCSLIGGDFLESVPEGGDTYLLKWIVHDWDDTRATTILRNCRRAMGPSSKVLLVEGIIPAGSASAEHAQGLWDDVLMMVLLMAMFALIRRHYDWFQAKIALDPTALPAGVPPAVSVEHSGPRDHVIVPVDGVNKISCGAIAMAREISGMVTAVHVSENREEAERFAQEWERAVPDVPLVILESPYRAFTAPMLRYLELLDQQEDLRITVILPTFVPRHWWERVLHNRDVLRLRPFLKDRPGLRVVDFPYRLYDDDE